MRMFLITNYFHYFTGCGLPRDSRSHRGGRSGHGRPSFCSVPVSKSRNTRLVGRSPRPRQTNTHVVRTYMCCSSVSLLTFDWCSPSSCHSLVRMWVIYLIVLVSHLTSSSLNDRLGKRPLLSVPSKLAGFSDGNGCTIALLKM